MQIELIENMLVWNNPLWNFKIVERADYLAASFNTHSKICENIL